MPSIADLYSESGAKDRCVTASSTMPLALARHLPMESVPLMSSIASAASRYPVEGSSKISLILPPTSGSSMA